MPPTNEVRTPFNLQMNTEERRMLAALVEITGTSGGAEIRAALRSRYQHIIMGVPTCGNNQACFVPQMHARAAAPIHQPPLPGVNGSI